ncbi:MAG: FAD-dependent oxidoreductase [Bacteroidales bacterium]|nr:FAD-dependent oxidoreductase [Bacteroidales bacterium]
MKKVVLYIFMAVVVCGCEKIGPGSSAHARCDICVYGATSGGVIAAYTAKSLGKDVILIEPGTRIGGLSSGGLGQTDIGSLKVIQGLSLDFYRRIGAEYGKSEPVYQFEPHVALKVFQSYLDEAGISVRYNHRICSAEKEKNRVKSITLEDTAGGKCIKIKAKVFIDCSYEGDLMAKAGISYTVGRESNAQYGETLNGVQMLTGHQFPDGVDPYVVKGDPSSGLLYGILPGRMGSKGEGDKSVQAYNFRITLTDKEENMIPITEPENYDPSKYELMLRLIEVAGYNNLNQLFIWSRMPGNKTDINNRNGFSTDMIGANWNYPNGDYKTREKIFKDHLDYTKGMLYFVGHDERMPLSIRKQMASWGYPRDEYQEYGHFTPQLYIRESRRMVGRMVMTQDYCALRKVANDPVGWAAYNMDSHNCGRYVVNGMVKNEGNVEVAPKGVYNISYRAITPKEEEADNVIVTFCLSASHIAFGSIRMEPVLMVLSESAAIAACDAIDKHKSNVQSVDALDIMNIFNKL